MQYNPLRHWEPQSLSFIVPISTASNISITQKNCIHQHIHANYCAHDMIKEALCTYQSTTHNKPENGQQVSPVDVAYELQLSTRIYHSTCWNNPEDLHFHDSYTYTTQVLYCIRLWHSNVVISYSLFSSSCLTQMNCILEQMSIYQTARMWKTLLTFLCAWFSHEDPVSLLVVFVFDSWDSTFCCLFFLGMLRLCRWRSLK